MTTKTVEQCGFCGGKMRAVRVETIRSRDGKIYILKGVPSKECIDCGMRYFDYDVVNRMDQAIRCHGESSEKVEATVVSYPEEKEAA